jgi:hypothetical protein
MATAAAAIGIGNMSDLGTAKGSNTFLAIAPAPLDAKRCALAVVIASFVAFCALVPFARVPLPRIEAFIPISESIFGLDCLVTAGFLLVQFSRDCVPSSSWRAGISSPRSRRCR